MVKKEYSRAKAELILFREELTTKNDKSTKRNKRYTAL